MTDDEFLTAFEERTLEAAKRQFVEPDLGPLRSFSENCGATHDHFTHTTDSDLKELGDDRPMSC